jgi:hypothetical protein
VLNDAYREMAAHYSAAVLPGRVKHPKDYSEDSVIPSFWLHPFAEPDFVTSYSG